MAGLVIAYALLARRLTLANITAPILSVVAGVAVFSQSHADIDTALVHRIAELTLIIILFHDASTVRLAQLRKDPGVALRLLAIGFPLTVLLTLGTTAVMYPALGFAGALLVAAAISPTDAGLGAPTVLNPEVPMRVRRGLNVESGLNDGLATPIVLVALSVIASEEGTSTPSLISVSVLPVLLAIGSATTLALLTAWAMDRSRSQHLSGRHGRAIATLALPLLLLGVAEMIGGNAFIAAFVGGLVFGAASNTLENEHETASLLEVASDLLGFVVWFFAGGLLLEVIGGGFDWTWLLLAVLALTFLRMVPVWISLLGTGFKIPTVAFLGWFGPRGLATIVFGLLAFEELGDQPAMQTIAGVISCTVLLSVFAHGISAGPLSAAFARWARTTDAPVLHEPSVEPMRTRGRSGH